MGHIKRDAAARKGNVVIAFPLDRIGPQLTEMEFRSREVLRGVLEAAAG